MENLGEKKAAPTFGTVERYREEIVDIVDKIEDLWILNEIIGFIQNIAK